MEGIGVEFDIVNDTLTVVSPISGGPSEKLGVQAGDKIVEIDNINCVKISREDVPKKLRGKKGTIVIVKIIRNGMSNALTFEITRDKIPLYSVDASFMYDKNIGYIKISRFASTTYDEFMQAVKKLVSQGMTQMVLDLRGNPGGYLDQSFKIASEFIPAGRKIVYTKGRVPEFNETYKSYGGSLVNVPLVVLINGGSASASEIVTGAIQDWDRGVIVGETSFGKGLVQRQYDLVDGSAVRVTTSRYYTPAGRSIQKPYEGAKYKMLDRGDFVEGDNLEHNNDTKDSTRPVFKTLGGRTIYGGGGITPDYFVRLDTLTQYTVQLRRVNLIYQFVEKYMSGNRKSIESKYTNYMDFAKNFEVSGSMYNELVNMANGLKIEYSAENYNRDKRFIATMIKAQIARDIWGNEGYYAIFMIDDEQFSKAITLFDEAISIMKMNK